MRGMLFTIVFYLTCLVTTMIFKNGYLNLFWMIVTILLICCYLGSLFKKIQNTTRSKKEIKTIFYNTTNVFTSNLKLSTKADRKETEKNWLAKIYVLVEGYISILLVVHLFFFDKFSDYLLLIGSVIISAIPMFITGWLALRATKATFIKLWQTLTILLAHIIIETCLITGLILLTSLVVELDIYFIIEALADTFLACFQTPGIILYFCVVQVSLLLFYISSLNLEQIKTFKSSCELASIIGVLITFIIHVFYREVYKILDDSLIFKNSNITPADLKATLLALLIGITLCIAIVRYFSERRILKLLKNEDIDEGEIITTMNK